MNDNDFHIRFNGIKRLYGSSAFEKITQSHVLVIGLGGVGSWVVESLARSGVGELTLIDLDEVCLSNTNRQLQALSSTVGQSKAQLLEKRVLDINPLCRVHVILDFVTSTTIEQYFQKTYDIVADCIDGVGSKCEIISFLSQKSQSLICAGAAAGKVDPLKIRIDDLSRTRNDLLLSRVRKKLRQDYAFPRGRKKFGVTCVYSEELAVYPDEEGEVCSKVDSAVLGKAMDCDNGMGSATHLTGALGFVMASEILKKIGQQ